MNYIKKYRIISRKDVNSITPKDILSVDLNDIKGNPYEQIKNINFPTAKESVYIAKLYDMMIKMIKYSKEPIVDDGAESSNFMELQALWKELREFSGKKNKFIQISLQIHFEESQKVQAKIL